MDSSILTATQYVSKNISYIGDIICYSLLLKNNSNSVATNVTIKNILPSNTELIKIIVNGYPQTTTINSFISYNIGNLSAGNSAEIMFIVKVTSLPNTNLMQNIAIVHFGSPINSINVNPVFTEVKPPNLKSNETTSLNNKLVNSYSIDQKKLPKNAMTITQSTDKMSISFGDTITYFFNITNTSPIPLQIFSHQDLNLYLLVYK